MIKELYECCTIPVHSKIGMFTFYGQKLAMANDQMFYIFVSKVQNEQGILLFVHQKLAPEW